MARCVPAAGVACLLLISSLLNRPLNATQRNATQRNATKRNGTQHNATQRNSSPGGSREGRRWRFSQRESFRKEVGRMWSTLGRLQRLPSPTSLGDAQHSAFPSLAEGRVRLRLVLSEERYNSREQRFLGKPSPAESNPSHSWHIDSTLLHIYTRLRKSSS